MRPVVALDAALLAIPNSASDAQEAQRILDSVIDWSGCVATNSPVRVSQLSDTLDTLAELNYFPNLPDIDALLAMFRLKHVYTGEDIRRSINTILDRAPHFGSLFGREVKRVIFCETAPDVFGGYDGPLRPMGQRTVASAISADIFPQSEPGDLLFAALGARSLCPDRIQVQCDVEELRMSVQRDDLHVPFGVYGALRLTSSPQDVLLRLTPEVVWNRAEDAFDIHLAVSLEAFKILKKMKPKAGLAEIPFFHVGTEFYRSLMVNSAGPTGPLAHIVREACARLVLAHSKYSVRPLRGSSRKQKVRSSDGAEAFRTHVTKHHEGIRLMFWSMKSKMIELANIGPKNELRIEEGLLDGRVSRSWAQY